MPGEYEYGLVLYAVGDGGLSADVRWLCHQHRGNVMPVMQIMQMHNIPIGQCHQKSKINNLRSTAANTVWM